MTIVEASPQRVVLREKNFGLTQPKVSNQIVKSLSSEKPIETIELPKTTVFLYRVGDTFTGVNSNGELVYRMICQPTKIQGFKALYQCQVYDSRTVFFRHKGYYSLAHFVFFEHLLKESNGCVVSDRQQTENGERFWFRVMLEAFEKGYRIYYRDDVQKKTYEFSEISQVDKAVDKIWGSSGRFEAVRLVITKEKLPNAAQIVG